MSDLKILLIEPNKEPQAVTIKNEVEAIKKVVGGKLETIGLGKHYNIVMNEEGISEELPLNRTVGIHRFVGNLFICKHLDGVFDSLTDKEIETFAELFKKEKITAKEVGIATSSF